MGSSDARFNGQIFRKDQEIIIAKNRHLASLGSVRLVYDAAGYEAGRLLAMNSVSKLFQKYDDNTASSGVDTAVAVLFESVPVELFASTGDTQASRAIFGGELFNAKLVGSDANGVVDLKARVYTEADGVEIFKF